MQMLKVSVLVALHQLYSTLFTYDVSLMTALT